MDNTMNLDFCTERSPARREHAFRYIPRTHDQAQHRFQGLHFSPDGERRTPDVTQVNITRRGCVELGRSSMDGRIAAAVPFTLAGE
jgi:hypothetical protein